MKFSELDYSKLTEDEKYQIVMGGIKDISKQKPTIDTKSDLIIVLGCSPKSLEPRVKKMMELFRQGYSTNIHLTGGHGWQKIYKYEDKNTGQVVIDWEKRKERLAIIRDIISADLLGDKPTPKQFELYERFVQGMNDMMQYNHVKSFNQSQDEKIEDITESEFMKLIVLTNGGLPGAHFLHEPFSCSTQENMEYTKALLDSLLKKGELKSLKRIIVVTSSYHCRRAELTLKKYFPGVEILSCPATLDLEKAGISLDGSMRYNDYYMNYIDKECNAIINYTRNKSIANGDVSEAIKESTMLHSLEQKKIEIEI